jgi:ribosomal protein S18 acetylase RimI-like enzyme
MDYRIRPATPNDVDDLMRLRTEAERWLADAHIDQWSNPEFGAKAIDKWLVAINSGLTWVIVDEDHRVRATVSTGAADLDFWTPEDDPSNARYIYKLIVSRNAAGTNLGARILDWSARVAAVEARRWLRLDVWRTNTGLQGYYERLGFTHVRTEAPAHRLSGWMAQRPAHLLTHPAEPLLPLSELPIPHQLEDRASDTVPDSPEPR